MPPRKSSRALGLQRQDPGEELYYLPLVARSTVRTRVPVPSQCTLTCTLLQYASPHSDDRSGPAVVLVRAMRARACMLCVRRCRCKVLRCSSRVNGAETFTRTHSRRRSGGGLPLRTGRCACGHGTRGCGPRAAATGFLGAWGYQRNPCVLLWACATGGGRRGTPAWAGDCAPVGCWCIAILQYCNMQ